MESIATGAPTGPVTRGQKRYADEEEESRKRFAAEPGYVGPNDVVIEPDVKVEIKEELNPDGDKVEGGAVMNTIQDQTSVTVKEEITSEDELEDLIQFTGVQDADQSQESNTSVRRDLEGGYEEGQMKPLPNIEGARPLNSNEALTALQSECNRHEIDLSQIPNTETIPAEEVYRLRLEALLQAKKLENLELRRRQENAENEKKIKNLESRISEEKAENQKLKDNLQDREMAIFEQNMEIKHLQEAFEIPAENNTKIELLREDLKDKISEIRNLELKIENLVWELNPGANNLNELARRRPPRTIQSARKGYPSCNQRGLPNN